MSGKHLDLNKVTGAGLLITLGIIFGDIGTSPLYVLKSIIGTEPVTPQLVLGGLSCIFWTLTLQTTVKYIILTLRADNKGEGGILARCHRCRLRRGRERGRRLRGAPGVRRRRRERQGHRSRDDP